MFSKELSSGIVALLCLGLLTELTCTVYMYICNKHLCKHVCIHLVIEIRH